MRRYVVCVLHLEGFHCWPVAPAGDLEYLRYRHRHIFEIRMKFPVQGNDREIEINRKQNEISRYLLARYGNGESGCEFGGMACEHIAEELLEHFGASACMVLEDGFGGAEIVR